MYCSLLATRLRAQRCQGMLDVISAGKSGPLNANQALFLLGSAFEQQIIDGFVTLVFVSLYAVPPQHKVFGYVVDTITNQSHGHIVPRHSAVLRLVQLVILPVFDAFEIHDSVVIKVLAREYLILDASWMNIGKWVLMVVPSSKTQVDTADKGDSIVNDHEFLVMGLLTR